MKPYKWCRYCDKVPSECKCARPSIVITESEALDWFESLLDRPIPDHYDWSEREIVTNERTRLRALIAAERGKV